MTTSSETNNEQQTKVYPTQPGEDQFYFESEEDENMNIKTKVYDNGNKIKSAVLPVCGKVAVVRELLGKDTKEIARFMNGDQERYQMSAVTIATTIDSEKQTFEFFEQLKMKDYNIILSMMTDLNF